MPLSHSPNYSADQPREQIDEQSQSQAQSQNLHANFSPNAQASGHSGSSFSICHICTEVMNEKIACLIINVCNHAFHRACIENYLSNNTQCPVCQVTCELVDLQKITFPIKQPPKHKGRPRGAMSKQYNTRSFSRNLFQEPQAIEDPSLRSPNNTINSPHNQNIPNISNAPCVNPNIHSSTVDYSEINRMIEINITKILQNLNLRPNISVENTSHNNNNLPPHLSPNHLNQPYYNNNLQNNAQATPPVLNRNSFLSTTSSFNTDKITSIIQNWGLKFDGSSTIHVEEFLYRVRVLTNDNFNGDFNIITKNLHILLSGKARDWFWKYHKQVEVVNWNEFCQAIKSQYKDSKSPYDIREEIRNRKQKPGESFDSFYEAISNIMDRLPIPLSESDLIEILIRNLRPDIRHELLYVEVQSFSQLRKLVQKRESFLNDEYVRRNFTARNPNNNTFAPRRQISEIDANINPINNQTEGQDISVDAVQHSNSIPRCWNCDEPGHHWEDCLQDRSIFCYGCGEKNTYKPQCQNCLSRKSKNYKQVPKKEPM